MSSMNMGPEQLPSRPTNETYQIKPAPDKKSLVSDLAAKGAEDPQALASKIGMMKFGKAAFAKLAAKGRKNAQKGS